MTSIKRAKGKCPECGSSNLVSDEKRGEMTCSSCGMVLSQKAVNQEPEWRAFTSKEKERKRRVGPPLNLLIPDKGLSTYIGNENCDARGRPISPERKGQIRRLKMWNSRSRSHDGLSRNLNEALSILDRLVSQLDLPRTVKYQAALLYRKVITKKLIIRRSIEAVVMAVLYVACRMRSLPQTLDDLLELASSNIDKKTVGRYFRRIIRKLEIKLNPSNPHRFLSRFCSELHLSSITRIKARKIVALAQKARITGGKAPKVIAAASIYVASCIAGEKRSQKEVASITDSSVNALADRAKEIMKVLQGMKGLEKSLSYNKSM